MTTIKLKRPMPYIRRQSDTGYMHWLSRQRRTELIRTVRMEAGRLYNGAVIIEAGGPTIIDN